MILHENNMRRIGGRRMKIGMLTSGGDCQALNAAMRGVAKSLYNKKPDENRRHYSWNFKNSF